MYLVHTYIHSYIILYSDLLVWVTSVGLALAHPNYDVCYSTLTRMGMATCMECNACMHTNWDNNRN